MNQKDVKKREVLEFKEFLKVIADPWNPKNLKKEDRTGAHTIKLERPFGHIGWANPVFKHISKINYAGKDSTESGNVDQGITG
jgi:hypothetical protein